jgi:hypothetical protein
VTCPKNKADDFFKKWRQRKWADKEMVDATRENLEELGFPLLRNEAGVEVPRGSFAYADSNKLFSIVSRLTYDSCSCSQCVQVVCGVNAP